MYTSTQDNKHEGSLHCAHLPHDPQPRGDTLNVSVHRFEHHPHFLITPSSSSYEYLQATSHFHTRLPHLETVHGGKLQRCPQLHPLLRAFLRPPSPAPVPPSPSALPASAGAPPPLPLLLPASPPSLHQGLLLGKGEEGAEGILQRWQLQTDAGEVHLDL